MSSQVLKDLRHLIMFGLRSVGYDRTGRRVIALGQAPKNVALRYCHGQPLTDPATSRAPRKAHTAAQAQPSGSQHRLGPIEFENVLCPPDTLAERLKPSPNPSPMRAVMSLERLLGHREGQ